MLKLSRGILARSQVYTTAKHCIDTEKGGGGVKAALFLIKGEGLLLPLQLWWAESHSSHLDPVKHFLQTHIRSDFHPTVALWSIHEWVCEAPEREGSLKNTSE